MPRKRNSTSDATARILERLPDVVVNATAFFDGGDDRGEVVIRDDHVRCLLGDFRAGLAHGNSDVRTLDGRSVIDPIAGHRDHRVTRFPRADDPQLVLGGMGA